MKLILILLLLQTTVATGEVDRRVKFNDLLHDFCFYEVDHIPYKGCKSYIHRCVTNILSRPDDSLRTRSKKVMKAYRLCLEDI